MTVMALVGLGTGLGYSAGGSTLSFARQTERAFSLVTIASIVIGSFFLAATPALHHLDEQRGVFAGLAVKLVLLGVAGTRMPRPDMLRAADVRDEAPRERSPAWIDRPGYLLVLSYFSPSPPGRI